MTPRFHDHREIEPAPAGSWVITACTICAGLFFIQALLKAF